MEKLIITAAISGAEVTKKQNPAVPYTVQETVAEAKSAFDAGAAAIHLHVRHDDGTPTQDAERFREVIAEIKIACPGVLIIPSTGGAVTMTAKERLGPVVLKPEMASLDCGTMNFGGTEIFVNTEQMIIEFAQIMRENGVRPELECFDKSMIDMVARLAGLGHLSPPFNFNLVMGVIGGISATPRDLSFLLGSLPAGATACVTATGKNQFRQAAVAIASGVHVRVGLEDNLYLEKGRLAKNNGELVAKTVQLARLIGRDIASSAEARTFLSLPEQGARA